MFENNWKESIGDEDETVIEIPNFTYATFRTFLQYLYTDKIESTSATAEDFIEMFQLSNYCGEENLKRHCEEQLRALITVENFAEVYAFSVQFNIKTLLAAALDSVVPIFNNFVKSDGYQRMQDGLKIILIQELADEDAFVGMQRRPSFRSLKAM